METLLAQFDTPLSAAALAAAPAEAAAAPGTAVGPGWVGAIPLLPLLGVLVCAVWAALGIKDRLPAYATIVSIAGSFVLSCIYYFGVYDPAAGPVTVSLFEWIGLSWGDGPGESLDIRFSFMLDGLSTLWILFVTGLAAAIGLYAKEYMVHDVGRGYCRFFAAFGLFVFSMSCLVLGSNMIMTFLGWEGVGLCSYLLIGYYYKKPEAVAAGMKAFVVNRIGDLGLLMAVFLTFLTFGTLEYSEIFAFVRADVIPGADGASTVLSESWQVWVIPLLLCAGAFGKSAQLFFYVWLPDAMEGPTPVSALIHAATMVTAGVFLIARMIPLFLADPEGFALAVVLWSGTITALWSATIAMAQFDIKRIMGYSTISQLGFMFAGLGALTTAGGVFHVLTHAFFKATLFLACGAVMHGFAGQLDMRKLSGVWHAAKGEGFGGLGFKVVTIAMLVGCLNLAGFPFTAGYFSKDMILAEMFYTPDAVVWGSSVAGWVLLVTAGLTAYYTFRVFFRVFVGEPHYEPGDEIHDHEDHDHGEAHGHDPQQHGPHDDHHGHQHHAGFHPHAPGWAINSVLIALTVCSVLAAGLYFTGPHGGWASVMVHQSSADLGERPWGSDKAASDDDVANRDEVPLVAVSHPGHDGEVGHTHDHAQHHHDVAHAGPTANPLYAAASEAGITKKGTLLGFDPHKVMYYVSAVFGVVGIGAALFLHGPATVSGLGVGARREPEKVRADAVARAIYPVNTWAERKWYVDEFYHFIIVTPLRVIAFLSRWFDQLVVDGLVTLFGGAPRWTAAGLRPVSQTGVLHDYALRMVGGVALVLLIAAIALLRF